MRVAESRRGGRSAERPIKHTAWHSSSARHPLVPARGQEDRGREEEIRPGADARGNEVLCPGRSAAWNDALQNRDPQTAWTPDLRCTVRTLQRVRERESVHTHRRVRGTTRKTKEQTHVPNASQTAQDAARSRALAPPPVAGAARQSEIGRLGEGTVRNEEARREFNRVLVDFYDIHEDCRMAAVAVPVAASAATLPCYDAVVPLFRKEVFPWLIPALDKRVAQKQSAEADMSPESRL